MLFVMAVSDIVSDFYVDMLICSWKLLTIFNFSGEKG